MIFVCGTLIFVWNHKDSYGCSSYPKKDSVQNIIRCIFPTNNFRVCNKIGTNEVEPTFFHMNETWRTIFLLRFVDNDKENIDCTNDMIYGVYLKLCFENLSAALERRKLSNIKNRNSDLFRWLLPLENDSLFSVMMTRKRIESCHNLTFYWKHSFFIPLKNFVKS